MARHTVTTAAAAAADTTAAATGQQLQSSSYKEAATGKHLQGGLKAMKDTEQRGRWFRTAGG